MAVLSNRRVLKIAFPVVLSNATVPILGAVDTGVVGQLGEAAPIGAVGIGAIILTATYWIFGFLRMGTAGLTAQAVGAADRDESVALLMRALLIGFAAGFALILLQSVVFFAAFKLSPASAEVETLARDYMRIRIWSAPAAIAIYGLSGWLIGQERTGGLLALQLWTNGVNILLDLLFVLGFDWGVEGVAFATFLAEWSGLGLGLWLCRAAFRHPGWQDRGRIFDRVRLAHMMSVNRDIMLRSLMLQVIFVSFLFWGGAFGDVTLASNQVLLQFLYITAYAQDGFAFAAEALVGQAMGRRDRAGLHRAALLCSKWGAIVGAALSLCFLIFGPALIDVMTTAEPVRSTARDYLIYMVLAPVFGVASWMLDGIFIGATRARDMRDMMAISLVIYLAALAVLIPTLENHGLWLALLISFVVRGITLGSRYPALLRAAESG